MVTKGRYSAHHRGSWIGKEAAYWRCGQWIAWKFAPQSLDLVAFGVVDFEPGGEVLEITIVGEAIKLET